jgi:hypothetical protein
MDIKINQLKTEFTEIIDLRSKALSGFDKLKARINILKGIYAEYIKNNKQTIYLFGLDSFHFQGQLIDIEYNDLTRYFLAISNRMYCEYYKLYKIIIEYMNENMREFNIIEALKMDEKIPVYRDIEPFKQYEFDHVIDIHNHIIVLLNSLFTSISHKKHQLKNHLFKNKGGLNTDNFVLTFKHNILIFKNKTEMFMGYLSFFHKLHIKYLTRTNERANQINNAVTTDINFEDIMTNDTNKPDDSDTDSDSDDGNGGGGGGGSGGSGETNMYQGNEPINHNDNEVLSQEGNSETDKNSKSETDDKSTSSSITTSSKNDNKQSCTIKPKIKKAQITKEDINKIKKIHTFFQSKPLSSCSSDESSNISIKIEETANASINAEDTDKEQTTNVSINEEETDKEQNINASINETDKEQNINVSINAEETANVSVNVEDTDKEQTTNVSVNESDKEENINDCTIEETDNP